MCGVGMRCAVYDRMTENKIADHTGEYSVVLKNGSPEDWTCAMRLLLVNLKSIMKSYCTRIEPEIRQQERM